MKIIKHMLLVVCLASLTNESYSQENSIELFAKEDTYVRGDSHGDSNFGNEQILFIKHNASPSFSRRGYLKFECPGDVINTASIVKATLDLHLDFVLSDMKLLVFKTDTDWNENTLTWNNDSNERIRQVGEIFIDTLDQDTTISIEIGSYIIEQLETGCSEIGLALVASSTSVDHIKISSSESSISPQLSILVNPTMDLPESPSSLSATAGIRDISLHWLAGSNTFGYLLKRVEDDGPLVFLDSLASGVVSYTDNNLSPETEYSYELTAFNPNGTSNAAVLDVLTKEDQAYTYYIDSSNGSDTNDGLTASSPWQTLDRVNSIMLSPGSRVLFKRGETWLGKLVPQGSGSREKPIRIGAYGEGSKPVLMGLDKNESYIIRLHNQEYYEIDDLELTYEDQTPNSTDENAKIAIYVSARDLGAVEHLHFTNLYLHDIENNMSGGDAALDTKRLGGIHLAITGTTTPTYFDDVLIEGCVFKNVDRGGFSNLSSWDERSAISTFGEDIIGTDGGSSRTDDWVPSLNIVFRHNRFEHIGGNGIIVRNANKPIVEYNYFYFNGEDISGNATFCFNTDSALFQFNEAAYTVFNTGDTDARGIDSDYRTKHTLIQYNYLHHNGNGGVVATGGPGGPTSLPRFNIAPIIRFNLIAENERQGIATSGNLKKMYVYNNVICASEAINDVLAIRHNAWSKAAGDSTFYYNNIFFYQGNEVTFKLDPSTNNFFHANTYFGIDEGSIPVLDSAKIIGDPGFEGDVSNVPLDVDFDFSKLENFKIKQGAKVFHTGCKIPDHDMGLRDFYGNTLNDLISIGIDQFEPSVQEPLGIGDLFDLSSDLRLFPMPTSHILNVDMNTLELVPSQTNVTVLDTSGKKLYYMTVEAGHKNFAISIRDAGLKNGLYILKVENGDKKWSRRFVIN